MSIYGVFPGPNTGKYRPEKNSLFGHFSGSEHSETKVFIRQNLSASCNADGPRAPPPHKS